MTKETAPSSSVKIPSFVANFVVACADKAIALFPQRRPTAEQLGNVQIISHRGQRDDIKVFENTFAAFDPLIGSAVTGIEFDIRWTKDLVPVVAHDADMQRVLKDKRVIANITQAELRATRPEIPTLDEMIERYSPHFFLTIELKHERWRDFEVQQQRLTACLKKLKSGVDYIIMSFDTDLLQRLDSIPNSAKLGIAHSNVADVSAVALSDNWAGIGGHYLMLSKKIIAKHHAAGQKIALGFPHSKNSLFREVKRGADWVFCDDALRVVDWLQ